MSPLRFWLLVVALALFGRIFQTDVLWPEETLPLAAAQQMLAGETLYRDIWFDKPPGLAWFYAGAVRLAGHSGYGLRAAGVLYVLAITIAGYALARRLWGERAARGAALLLAFFTAFYIPAATTPLASDLLLVLPHLAVFYFAAAKRPWPAGVCAGAGFHLNAKAVFVAAAAAAWILLAEDKDRLRQAAKMLAGCCAGAAIGLGAVAGSGGWSGYREEVWRWGSAYASAPFSEHPWKLGLERTLHYLGFHAALVMGAAGYFAQRQASGRERLRMAVWLAVSFGAVTVGARFFPRYYFQLLPPLAMAAAAGWQALSARKAFVLLLAAALAVPAVRFGRVNLWLALGRSFEWRDAAMDADSRTAAARVAALTAAGDRIFVWGFRPEIYFYSRRLDASRFLESQPLTGVLADRHLQRCDPFHPEWAAQNRQELARALAAHRPAAIVDGLGPYNPALAIGKYAELKPVLSGYRLVEQTAGCRIYRRE
jgi:4-amino-4-deoxy-L-arabinose transferase-like glycosyltransferase